MSEYILYGLLVLPNWLEIRNGNFKLSEKCLRHADICEKCNNNEIELKGIKRPSVDMPFALDLFYCTTVSAGGTLNSHNERIYLHIKEIKQAIPQIRRDHWEWREKGAMHIDRL